jgi:hypothetical protein
MPANGSRHGPISLIETTTPRVSVTCASANGWAWTRTSEPSTRTRRILLKPATIQCRTGRSQSGTLSSRAKLCSPLRTKWANLSLRTTSLLLKSSKKEVVQRLAAALLAEPPAVAASTTAKRLPEKLSQTLLWTIDLPTTRPCGPRPTKAHAARAGHSRQLPLLRS